MTATIETIDVGALPLAPKNPLPILQALSAARALHTGLVTLSEAGGPVTRFEPLPKFFAPALVLVTSPSGFGMCWDARTDSPSAARFTRKCETWRATTSLSCPTKNGLRADAYYNRCSPNTTSTALADT